MSFQKVIENAINQANKNTNFYINQEGLKVCNKCNEPIEVRLSPEEQTKMLGLKKRPRMCKCERDKQEQDEEYEKKRRQQMRIEELRKRGITDVIYSAYQFSKDDGRNAQNIKYCKSYVANWATNKADNNGVLFFGDVGKGKSFMAGCIANALIDKGIYAYMTTLSRLVRNRIDKNSYTIDITEPDLLVIDDLGVEKITPTVFEIIDDRYRANKPTIITTNLTADKLKNPATLEERRVYDRILGMCKIKVLVDNKYNRFNQPQI
ncbi:MAG: ATP-binding protein [Ruminococcus sp.]|nr:ATP-binding protein [Ruminococcus sp.]